jgi:hypothetical protein
MRPFESCWERVERAKTHRDALAEAWNTFVKNEHYSVSVRIEHDGTGRIFVRPTFSALPNNFSLEFGEMVYQLRAVLDGCVYKAAILVTKQDPPPDENYLEFPICPSRKQFKNAARSIAPLPQDCRKWIESVQPYNTPKTLKPAELVISFNRNLGILHEWARKDRHRQLHLLGAWGSKASPNLRIPAGTTLRSLTVSGSKLLKDESEIASFILNGFIPGMEVSANPNLAIDIAVDEVPPPCADSDTLNNRLFNIFLFVESVVGGFESFFLGKKSISKGIV